MSIISHLFLAGLVATTVSTAAVAASQRPAETWNYYHFDGQRFVAGRPLDAVPCLAVRDHMQPVAVTQAAPVSAVELPAGKGAIAGICYIQSAGGKLGAGSAYLPCSHMPITVSSGGRAVATMQTDEQGYFIAVLDAGSYRIGSAPLAVDITIKKGTTTLAPLRAGKRMAD